MCIHFSKFENFMVYLGLMRNLQFLLNSFCKKKSGFVLSGRFRGFFLLARSKRMCIHFSKFENFMVYLGLMRNLQFMLNSFCKKKSGFVLSGRFRGFFLLARSKRMCIHFSKFENFM